MTTFEEALPYLVQMGLHGIVDFEFIHENLHEFIHNCLKDCIYRTLTYGWCARQFDGHVDL